MRKYKCLAALVSVLLLSGCNASENAETVSEQSTASETVSEQTTVSEIVQSETTTAESSEASTDTLEQATSQTVSASVSEQTNASVTTQQTEDTDFDIPEEDIVENVDNGSEIESELGAATIYKDKITNEYFIMLNVTPQKVYWNEIDGYDVTVGQAMDIAVPAVFEEWLADADGVMLYLSEYERTFGDINIDDKKIKGMTYPQYWCRDYLCTIKDGTLRFDDYTDEIGNYFRGFSDGVNIEWGNIQYPENPLQDGMRVENLDLYFETVKADYEELEALIAANPNTEFEISPLFTEQGSGVRFRATINYIY